jgi:DNA repair photolyase
MKTITGTNEWANTTRNICNGCRNDCKYCWAKAMAIRFGRNTPETWKDQIALPDRLAKTGKGKPTRIMFPSTHDITIENLDICMDALDRMLSRGHTILVVSKPQVKCISAICERFGNFKDRLIFRFTIGSTDDTVLKFWEPNAPSFVERILALEMASDMGFQTSISCEPMLDTNVERVVKAVTPFVTDTIWIGMMNDVKQRLAMNGADALTLQRGIELAQSMNATQIMELYRNLKDNAKIRWKDTIRKMIYEILGEDWMASRLDEFVDFEEYNHAMTAQWEKENVSDEAMANAKADSAAVEARRNGVKAIYTIGTQGMNDGAFTDLLQSHNIDLVLDVRLKNEGQRYRFASGRHIKELVEGHGIAYRHDVRLAPTAQMQAAWRAGGDWSAYVEQYSKLIADREMIKLIKEHLQVFKTPCLLCAEEDAVHCHSRLLAERMCKEFCVLIIHLKRKVGI